MEVQKEQNQKSKKNSWLFNYKIKVIENLNKKSKLYLEGSPSWVLFDRILSHLFDIVMWIIIGYFVYIWWITRLAPIGCDRISVDLCNNCFGVAKNMLTGALG